MQWDSLCTTMVTETMVQTLLQSNCLAAWKLKNDSLPILVLFFRSFLMLCIHAFQLIATLVGSFVPSFLELFKQFSFSTKFVQGQRKREGRRAKKEYPLNVHVIFVSVRYSFVLYLCMCVYVCVFASFSDVFLSTQKSQAMTNKWKAFKMIQMTSQSIIGICRHCFRD